MPAFSPTAITWRCVRGLERGRPATTGSVLLNQLLSSCHATTIGITSNTNISAWKYLLHVFRGFSCSVVLSSSGDDGGFVSDISLLRIFLSSLVVFVIDSNIYS